MNAASHVCRNSAGKHQYHDQTVSKMERKNVNDNITERLTVENFAGIKKAQIEIGKMNLFIGPQATGKSVCAKLLYFFKSFHEEIVNAILEEGKSIENGGFDGRMIRRWELFFPPDTWAPATFKIEYEIGDLLFSVKRPSKKTSSLSFHTPELINHFLQKGRSEKKKLWEQYSKQNTIVHSQLDLLWRNISELIYRDCGKFSCARQFFIPAGRSFFAHLETSMFSFLSSNSVIDPFLIEFGKFYSLMRLHAIAWTESRPSPASLRRAEEINQEILGGEYRRNLDEDFLHFPDGRKVRLANASSGQQEMLPLGIVLKWMISGLLPTGGTLYIEEPEAHLFPDSQRMVVELMAYVFNKAESNLQFVITTHSPYILSAFNNLIYAGGLAQRLPKGKLSRLADIVPKEQMLSAEDVRAYAFQKGGVTNLYSKDTGLLTADVIDGVSEELAAKFGELLEVEYK